MGNIMDYLDWRGDLSFEQDPFNEVDSLILTAIVYLSGQTYQPKEGEEKTIRQIVGEYFETHDPKSVYIGIFFDKGLGEFALKMGNSERFGHIKVMRRVNRVNKEKQRQFCAVTFRLSKNLYYIAYKGTDDSLIGWWENLNTLVTYPVIAQSKAALYAKGEMNRFPEGRFYLGGHSKGGNLAVYAAYQLSESEQARLIKIYSNDGQGFTPGKFEREKYERIRDKVVQIVPEDCLVGNLLEEYPCEKIVVKTTGSGIMEHDCFRWNLCGNRFNTLPDVSEKSKNMRDGINELISSLTEEDKQDIVDEMYTLITNMEAETLTDLLKRENRLVFFRSVRSLSPKCSKIFFAFARICIANGMFF